MTGASLALFVVLGQVRAPDPAELVNRLGAPKYAEREAAASALEQLGRPALPALRAAREQRDPEVRSRANALLARIEGALLTQPSRVTLDFENTTLTDVVQSFSEQSGIKLTLLPESPNWQNRRVTLHEPSPLSFWKAIDRLCDAAHLQYNFGMHAFPNGREPAFPLFEGGVRPSAPFSDSGPFRVCLVTLHRQRDVTFPPGPQFGRNLPNRGQLAGQPAPHFSEQFYAQMQVAGEPRLSLIQNGPLKIIEAVDDKSNNLIPPSSGNADVRRSGYFGYATGSVVQLKADMVPPATPGTVIKRLKGVVPLLVSTRKPNPLVASLTGASGRTFQNDDVSLTVHEVRLQGNNRPPTIEVTIRPAQGSASASAAGAPGNDGAVVRPDTHQQQLEINDAQGHPLPWYQSSFDADAGRMTISLTSGEQAAAAAELRYYSLVRAATEVPFEFTDLPLP